MLLKLYGSTVRVACHELQLLNEEVFNDPFDASMLGVRFWKRDRFEVGSMKFYELDKLKTKLMVLPLGDKRDKLIVIPMYSQ